MQHKVVMFQDTVVFPITGQNPENLLMVHTCESAPTHQVNYYRVILNPRAGQGGG